MALYASSKEMKDQLLLVLDKVLFDLCLPPPTVPSSTVCSNNSSWKYSFSCEFEGFPGMMTTSWCNSVSSCISAVIKNVTGSHREQGIQLSTGLTMRQSEQIYVSYDYMIIWLLCVSRGPVSRNLLCFQYCFQCFQYALKLNYTFFSNRILRLHTAGVCICSSPLW